MQTKKPAAAIPAIPPIESNVSVEEKEKRGEVRRSEERKRRGEVRSKGERRGEERKRRGAKERSERKERKGGTQKRRESMDHVV
jgi:hypothetical protein